MIHFDLPKEKSSIIKVIGVGGGGSNAVNHMFSQNIEGVNFIICNTDAQAIATSRVPNKVQLGPHLTQGLGAGANPDIGRQATEESLEEIKQILEVNTKMAFITAGMGGGTGTGGAPIISKICKDLGILTVGIITTPFSYEGKKRQLQAEEGIRVMKQYVDTLLVISNDKLRHQFGNLKMKEAFAKADNVLATAAKCITDVINSTGQINVDFADVCTVMRNGGVAILGSATAKGDGRAQRAIEEALNSPLLNDNDIRGAKWILININSCEGEHEFTMDEVEIIQNYLLSHAGENTDVILGLGYDNTLGAHLGITLIATGFEHREPFTKEHEAQPAPKKEEKIVMTLGMPAEEQIKRPVLPATEIKRESPNEKELPAVGLSSQLSAPLPDSLQPKLVDNTAPPAPPLTLFSNEEPETVPAPSASASGDRAPRIEWVLSSEPEVKPEPAPTPTAAVQPPVTGQYNSNGQYIPAQPAGNGQAAANVQLPVNGQTAGNGQTAANGHPPVNGQAGGNGQATANGQPSKNGTNNGQITGNIPSPGGVRNPSTSAASGGYLARPSNIYAEEPRNERQSNPEHSGPVKPPVLNTTAPNPPREEETNPDMQLVFRDNGSATDEPGAHQTHSLSVQNASAEEPAMQDDTDDPKRRAAERINKLRNLSFNINAADPNNEFETVPAYIRRNLELYNTISNVENFYSNYEVKTDENNNTEISTINTFLDGKRPD